MAEGRFDTARPGGNRAAKTPKGQPCAGINMQFCILSALGMFFVVDGHLNNSYLDIGGLVPYYSFHMPLFAFISGYFYKREASTGWESMRRKNNPSAGAVYGVQSDVRHDCPGAPQSRLCLWGRFELMESVCGTIYHRTSV